MIDFFILTFYSSLKRLAVFSTHTLCYTTPLLTYSFKKNFFFFCLFLPWFFLFLSRPPPTFIYLFSEDIRVSIKTKYKIRHSINYINNSLVLGQAYCFIGYLSSFSVLCVNCLSFISFIKIKIAGLKRWLFKDIYYKPENLH